MEAYKTTTQTISNPKQAKAQHKPRHKQNRQIACLKPLCLLLTLALLGGSFTGCGKISDESSSSGSTGSDAGTSQNNSDDAGTSAESSEDTEAEGTPEPNDKEVTFEMAYSDPERSISILGLSEYKKLKSDKYTDKASKGNVFLVLFLKVTNAKEEADYFNVYNLTATLDGEEIENTVLFNDPEGYTTMFTNVEAGSSAGGFIVWEVPKDWQAFEVSYNGWQGEDGIVIHMSFTPEDLQAPDAYDENNFQ